MFAHAISGCFVLTDLLKVVEEGGATLPQCIPETVLMIEGG